MVGIHVGPWGKVAWSESKGVNCKQDDWGVRKEVEAGDWSASGLSVSKFRQ